MNPPPLPPPSATNKRPQSGQHVANNKRIKCDINSVTNGINSLSTNGHQMDNKDDPFGDDDAVIEDMLSQITQTPKMATPARNGSSGVTQPMATQFTHIANQYLLIDQNQNNGNNNTDAISRTDASVGRQKILESQIQKLREEVTKYKTLAVQSQRRERDVKEECTQKMDNEVRRRDLDITFLKSELQHKQFMIDRMEGQMRQSQASGVTNAPKLGSTFIQKRNNRQTYSQIKGQEFYAGLHVSANSSQAMSIGGSSAIGSTPRGIKDSQGMPTEIPATQSPLLRGRMTLSHTQESVQMDTSGWPDNNANNSSNTTQTQSARDLSEPIRCSLETKFTSNCQHLSQYFIDQQIKLFSDEWQRKPQELNDWSQSLNDLSVELAIGAIIKY